MAKRILLGWGRWLLPLPEGLWRRRVANHVHQLEAHLGFMTPEHHRVRNLAVRSIADSGQPLAVDSIVQTLGLAPARVAAILGDLERHLTFLFRDAQGAVSWAYPVTSQATPHRVALDSGREVFAA
ncbi:MAG: hypothetical protein V1806_17825 [Pseudomonadota bacterium]